MKNKKLKKYTIIPSSLYIERDSDELLRMYIHEMQNPVCIIGPRQIGKTNLILHAKQKLEKDNNIVIYLDLSIPPSTIQLFFRSIINITIETLKKDKNVNDFEIKNLQTKIQEIRKLELDSTQEFDTEVKFILKHIDKNLIIMFDEVDALLKKSYSSNVFAKIRSQYFSRLQVPEFYKITYIISGVINIIELIEEKSISPFNIPEKIDLVDFSFDEFETFLLKAGLFIENIIKKRIYYWLNGNPRMIWDVCAYIEDILETNKTIDIDTIDKIIFNFYINHFDKPPIDHIVRLINENNILKKCSTDILLNLKYNINNIQKEKLKLAGIICIDSEKKIKIRNRVIKLVLLSHFLKYSKPIIKEKFVYKFNQFVKDDQISKTMLYLIMNKNIIGIEKGSIINETI